MNIAKVICMSSYRKEKGIQEPGLGVGARVHCILYGGRNGIVYQVHGTPKPESVRRLGPGISAGGRATFDVVFDDGTVSRQVPESIITGVQWRTLEGRATVEEIKSALEFAEKQSERKRREKEEAQRQRELARVAVKEEYPHLIENPGSGGVDAAKNVRRDLKKHFPGVKFSVRSSYDSIRVAWTDGPVPAAVKDVVSKYEEGSFNGMEDLYEYSPSAFNDVFGGCKYVFESRDFSDEAVKAAIDGVWIRHDEDVQEIERPTVEDYRSGRLYNLQVPGAWTDMQRLVFDVFNKTHF